MSSAPISHVTELTDTTFDPFLQAHNAVLVAFYLTWVPRYAKFAAAYEEAAKLSADTGVSFVRVNCETQEAVNSRFKYTSWPTISILRGPRKAQDLEKGTYAGPLRGTNLSYWIKRQVAPIVTVLDAETVRNFRNASEVVVIGFFAENDPEGREVFGRVAEELKSEYMFGIVDDGSVAEREGIAMPGIIMYKNFDEQKNVVEFTADVDGVVERVRKSAKPLVEEFLSETHRNWLNGNVALGYVFVDGTEPASFTSDIITPLAKEFDDKIQFGIVQLPTLNYLAEDTHVNTQHLPAFAIVNPTGMRNYPFKQPPHLSQDNIRAFTQDFLDGKLKPTAKSAPIPKTQGPVLEIVADTWDELVVNNDKDVLVEYYTQTCGPCKALLPAYTRLAETYAADPATRDKIVLAKVDAEENDVDLNIRGFPTFKLFAVGKKDYPVFCDCDRRPIAWAQFIAENGGHKVPVPENLIAAE